MKDTEPAQHQKRFKKWFLPLMKLEFSEHRAQGEKEKSKREGGLANCDCYEMQRNSGGRELECGVEGKVGVRQTGKEWTSQKEDIQTRCRNV